MITREFITIKIAVFCLFFSCIFSNYVYWEPEIPIPGSEITIYYNTMEGSLPNNTFPAYIHLGYNGWQETDDYAMSYAPFIGTGWWYYTYQIPEDAETIDFVFTDLNDNWDNNGGLGIDWHISMNYYWSPFNPTPNDSFNITLNNINQGGYIVWTVDSGSGHINPIEDYWPIGSFLNNGLVHTPLNFTSDNSIAADFNSFQSGSQVVSSLKFKILWEDGSYDVGENGQIIYYDIYFDYNLTDDDPYVDFISPENNQQLTGDVSIVCQGDADNVELWLNGDLLTVLTNEPFNYLWEPDPGFFGDLEIIAKAIYDSGQVSFSFVDFNLQYQINNVSAPIGINDGLNIDGNNVIIALYAPGKEYVSITGSWNSEFPNGEIMNLSGDTLWWYQKELDDGNYTYQYNLEGVKYVADPWSLDVEWVDPFSGNESGNFQDAKTFFAIGEEEYTWNDDAYIRPETKDLVIYELNVGDFLGQEGITGTYSEIINKIQSGYFNDLGINAIELMPINEFEGSYSWGYNTSYAMAPESSYGTPNDLKNLIDIAHQNNIAILLDVVYNHMWGSSPLFQLYHPLDNYEWDSHDFSLCPYFDNAPSDWGYKLEHWHEVNGRQYRGWKYVEDALKIWVEEYHVDGFRFDYVDGIGWGDNNDGAAYYVDLLDNLDPSLILIAEADNASQINTTDFDSGWDYSYHHNLFDNILGIYVDVDNVTNHINAYNQGYGFVTGPINYIESHDENRLIYQSTEFQNHSLEEAYQRSMLGASILFTSHGVPMIYSGQEFAQNAPVRDAYGFPISQPLQWSNLENENVQELNNHYKKLISLRNNYDILKEPPLELKYSSNSTNSIVYWRADENQKIVIAINLGIYPQVIDIEFPHNGEWNEYIGDTQIQIDTNWYGGFNLLPLTAYIFLPNEEEPLLLGDLNFDGIINVIDIVAMVNGILSSQLTDEQQSMADLNSDGVINVIDIVALVNMILSS